MASYTITLSTGASFPCADDTYILDAAEEQALTWPSPAVLGPAAPVQAR